MSGFLTIVLSTAVIAAFVIGGSGVYIALKRPAERRKGLLMIVVALVTIINVWLLSAPLP